MITYFVDIIGIRNRVRFEIVNDVVYKNVSVLFSEVFGASVRNFVTSRNLCGLYVELGGLQKL